MISSGRVVESCGRHHSHDTLDIILGLFCQKNTGKISLYYKMIIISYFKIAYYQLKALFVKESLFTVKRSFFEFPFTNLHPMRSLCHNSALKLGMRLNIS